MRRVSLLLVGFFLAGLAFAQQRAPSRLGNDGNTPAASPSADANSNDKNADDSETSKDGTPYMIGAFGRSTIENAFAGDGEPLTHGFGSKFLLGYLFDKGNLGQGWAVEGGWVNYGTSTVDASRFYASNKVSVQSKALSMVYIKKQNKIYYRGGLGVGFNTITDNQPMSENSLRPRLNLGLFYRLNNNTYLLGEYEATAVRTAANPNLIPGNVPVSMFSVGVRVNFFRY